MQKTKLVLKYIAGALALIIGVYFASLSIQNFFDIPSTADSQIFFISTTSGVCYAVIAFVIFFFIIDMIINMAKQNPNNTKSPINIIAIYTICQVIMQATNMIVYSLWTSGGLWFNIALNIVIFVLSTIAIWNNKGAQKTNLLAMLSTILLLAIILLNFVATNLYVTIVIIITLVLAVICYAINLSKKDNKQSIVSNNKVE